MEIIFDYNRTIFNPETGELYPGVFEILLKLSKHNQLYLISQNEKGRAMKLNNLGIKPFFKKVVFVNEKTVQSFVELVGHTHDVMVIGDRVKYEIKIGNKLGYVTVWLRQGKFACEIPKNKVETPTHIIDEISQIYEIIDANK